MKNKKLSAVALVALLAAACASPVTPTPVVLQGPAIDLAPDPGHVQTGGDWPVYIDGTKEDPNVPPEGDECPVGYHADYTGWNWVCRDAAGNTTFPWDFPPPAAGQ